MILIFGKLDRYYKQPDVLIGMIIELIERHSYTYYNCGIIIRALRRIIQMPAADPHYKCIVHAYAHKETQDNRNRTIWSFNHILVSHARKVLGPLPPIIILTRCNAYIDFYATLYRKKQKHRGDFYKMHLCRRRAPGRMNNCICFRPVKTNDRSSWNSITRVWLCLDKLLCFHISTCSRSTHVKLNCFGNN